MKLVVLAVITGLVVSSVASTVNVTLSIIKSDLFTFMVVVPILSWKFRIITEVP